MNGWFYLYTNGKSSPLFDGSGCPIIVNGKNIINIGKPCERLWLYWLYSGIDNNGELYIQQWLKGRYSWMTDVKANEIITSFKNSHPVHSGSIGLADDWCEQYHPKGYLLPISLYQSPLGPLDFKITPAREKELVSIITKAGLGKEFLKIKKWFREYAQKHYEVWSRKDINALAVATAIQYGVAVPGYGYNIPELPQPIVTVDVKNETHNETSISTLDFEPKECEPNDSNVALENEERIIAEEYKELNVATVFGTLGYIIPMSTYIWSATISEGDFYSAYAWSLPFAICAACVGAWAFGRAERIFRKNSSIKESIDEYELLLRDIVIVAVVTFGLGFFYDHIALFAVIFLLLIVFGPNFFRRL